MRNTCQGPGSHRLTHAAKLSVRGFSVDLVFSALKGLNFLLSGGLTVLRSSVALLGLLVKTRLSTDSFL